jgi:S-adenosylmethionine:tRNA ribosyltransferase-isomerase
MARRPAEQRTMRTSDFTYHLPPALIARHPVEPRTASRLLHVDGAHGRFRDLRFADLPALLKPSDLLVFNDTRVIPARLLGVKQSGGRVEVLIERVLDAHRARAQVRASKPPRAGQRLDFEGGVRARVCARDGEFYELEFDSDVPVFELLERAGHVPLPPYLARPAAPADRARYQTVYARHPGAVAAPTAGLHFDEALLDRLKTQGVEFGWLTLHVGAGTFQPVRVEQLTQHRMHAERVRVGARLCDQVNAARAVGRRVVAVGTTVVRALESAAGADGRLAPFDGETALFIYPGYRFRAVDALLTNFHLPGSTLLMLVCALGGTETVLAAYRHAVEQKYRFYSYGDAMWLTPGPGDAPPAGG